MTARPNQQPLIDLLSGWPNPALLPAPDLLRSATTVLTTPSIAHPGLLYGPDEGYEPLRAHVAEWLGAFYQPCDQISSGRICITGGASQNLACVMAVFTDPVYTRGVWMVDPTYHLAGRIVDDAGFAGRVRGVPEDDEGIDLAFLESGLRAAEEKAHAEGNTEPKFKPPRPWRKIYKYIIYAVPTFANPSTKVMSLGHREELVRLARKYDALLVTDDVYDFLQWSPTPGGKLATPEHACLPRLVDVDRYLDGGPIDEWGHAISNGSFSKLLGPGLRTGWAEASEKVAYGLSQVGSSRSGGAPSQLCSTIIDQLLPSGILDNYIQTVLQPAYSERYHALQGAIEEYLVPLGATVASSETVAGGYFIWLTLPPPLLAADIVQRAQQEENLRLAPGTLFEAGSPQPPSDRFANCLRLCFAWEEPRHLTEGVRRLARVLKHALE
ncbi:valine--pyruvate aminotransferase [Penicillium ochrochloron]